MFFRLISINFHCNSNFDFRWIEKKEKCTEEKEKNSLLHKKK